MGKEIRQIWSDVVRVSTLQNTPYGKETKGTDTVRMSKKFTVYFTE